MLRRLPIMGNPTFYLNWLAALVGLVFARAYSYVLFHSLVEIFAILIGGATFLLAWNARRFLSDGYLLFIGISSLFVAVLELAHTLAYKGVGIFTGYDANLPTQLWLATRYMSGVSLLAAPAFLSRRFNARWALVGYSLITLLLLVAIFSRRYFPVAYVEGQGLTPFKVYSEYVIVALYLVAMAVLYRRRPGLDSNVFRLLVAAMLVSVVAELLFTLYIGVYDWPNMAGHLLMVVASYLVYRAIIETGLVRPYDLLFRELKQARDELEQRVAERTAALTQRENALREANSSLQELSRRLVEVQENERRRIARELHDEAGQALTALKLNLGLLAREPEFPPPYVSRVESLRETTDQVLEDLHRLAVDLRPVSLDRLGLVPALEQYLGSFKRQSNIDVEFVTVGLDGQRLPPEIETTVYRVVQEALTNVARHAQADQVGVIAERQDGHVLAIIEDNGVGFNPEEARQRGRLGLMGMAERVEMLGGELSIESAPGRGTTVLATIPFPQ